MYSDPFGLPLDVYAKGINLSLMFIVAILILK